MSWAEPSWVRCKSFSLSAVSFTLFKCKLQAPTTLAAATGKHQRTMGRENKKKSADCNEVNAIHIVWQLQFALCVWLAGRYDFIFTSTYNSSSPFFKSISNGKYYTFLLTATTMRLFNSISLALFHLLTKCNHFSTFFLFFSSKRWWILAWKLIRQIISIFFSIYLNWISLVRTMPLEKMSPKHSQATKYKIQRWRIKTNRNKYKEKKNENSISLKYFSSLSFFS